IDWSVAFPAGNMATVVMNIENHGTLRLEYDDIGPDTFVVQLMAGGTFTFRTWYEDHTVTGSSSVVASQEGTWGDDWWYARDNASQTYSGKSGDDLMVAGTGGTYTLRGGVGNDEYRLSGDSFSRLQDGTGMNTVRALDVNAGEFSVSLDAAGYLNLYRGGALFATIENPDSFGSVMLGDGTLYGVNDLVNDIYAPYAVGEEADTVDAHSAGVGLAVDLLGGDDFFFGSAYADFVRGGDGADTLSGGAGSDILKGGTGDDTLEGGAGADRLEGGEGNDTYLVASGDGDTLRDEGGTDVVRFAGSLTAGDITLERAGQTDLEIWANGARLLTVYNQFDATGQIETLAFGDGSEIDLGAVHHPLTGTAGDDVLTGISAGGDPDDVIHGGSGDDTIYGYAGNDSLYGEGGNDTMYGGNGDDSYYVGEGMDTISDTGGFDTVHMAPGYSADDAQYFVTDTGALEISFAGTVALKVEHQDLEAFKVDRLVFADGTVVDLANLAFVQIGTEGIDTLTGMEDFSDQLEGLGGNDKLYGRSGNDILIGGPGGDRLDGAGGNDIYVWAPGDGSDSIYDYSGTDTIRLSGIGANDFRLDKDSVDLDIYIGDNFISVKNHFNYDAYGTGPVYRVEAIELDDGQRFDLTENLTFRGTNGRDYITGTITQGDRLDGLDGNDSLRGFGGDDVLAGGAGNDSIEGGDGTDTAVFSGNYADYSISGTPGSTLTVTDNAGTDGTDTIWSGTEYLRFADGVYDTTTGTFSVSQDNTDPVAADDVVTTDEDSAVTIDLLGNDSDADGDVLTIATLTAAAHGTVTDNGDGTVTYTPNANYNGTDGFTYTVSDGNGGTGTASVSVTVNPVNDAPVASDASFSVAEDAVNGTVLGAVSASDIDGDALAYAITGGNGDGIFGIDASGRVFVADSGALDYETAVSHLLAITVSDGRGGIDTASVSIAVSDVAEPSGPQAPEAGRVFLYETGVSGNIANSSDINLSTYGAKTLSASFETGADVGARQVIYEQGAGTRGLNMFVEGGRLYMAVWNNAEENWGYREVSANIAANTKYTATLVMDGALPADGTITGYLNGAEIGQATGVGLLYPHSGGIEVAASDGSVYHGTGSGAANPFSGTVEKLAHYNAALSGDELDQLQTFMAYEWLDGSQPVNTDPDAADDVLTTNEDSAVTVDLLANDSDADNDALNVVSLTAAAHGTVTDNGDGTVTYTPNANYNGTDSFTYTVSDGRGGSDTATVSVTVNPVNDAPVASDASFSVAEDAVTGTVLGAVSASDIDGDAPLSYAITGGNGDGIFGIDASGSVFVADSGALDYETAASHLLAVTVSDGNGGIDTASVSIAVSDVAEPSEPQAPGGYAVLLDPVGGLSGLADNSAINTGAHEDKTHSLAFETGDDVSTLQMVYEQGGGTRGLNFFVEGGKLYGAVWNYAEENWGYKELYADIAPNTKYTATLVMDGALPANGTASLYVNGSLAGTTGGIGKLYSHGDDIGIGQVAGGTAVHGASAIGSTAAAFTGTVEKLAHYNAALSGGELDQLQAYMANDWLGGGIPSEQVVLEFGSVTANQNTVTVDLVHNFDDPLVFLTMTSFNGNQIAVPRVTDVTSDSFTFYAQEADYLDGSHAVETFSYIVVERGSWTLSDGTRIEAGEVSSDRLTSDGWENIAFSDAFDETPSLFSQIQSENDAAYALTRQRNADTEGFQLSMQEEEAALYSDHGLEDIAWLAIETGAGSDDGFDFVAGRSSDTFVHNWDVLDFGHALDVTPQLLASISTTDGGDPSALRLRNLDTDSVDALVQEDQSKDSETSHTTERIDYFAIGGESGHLTGTAYTEFG
ncbi:MAG: tandem-95 repeat protein, partial [Alphaproteobacteria bacterium]|nr:tandem-95 repeat protein [Alphaproteobacteria bacterium]